jgi:hypothetical protein
MVRLAASAVALLVGLVDCGAAPAKSVAARAPPGATTHFTTEEQKILACLDLRDHIVDLYAHDYVTHEGVSMSSSELTAFRDGWAQELARRGTFERFEQTCFSGLTPGKYECGMQSQTPGGLVACMKLSSR